MPYQKKEMHSRDTTVLIDLLWFNVMHYSSLFQYFFSIYYCPYSNFLVHLLVNFFCKYYYYAYDWNTIQGRIQGSSKGSIEPPFYSSDGPAKNVNYGPYSSWKFLWYTCLLYFFGYDYYEPQ